MNTINEIINAVADEYAITGITFEALIGPRRFGQLAEARQVAMYVARKMTDKSYPQLGRSFGNRDHTTIMHGVKLIGRRLQTDTDMQEAVNNIMDRVITHTKEQELLAA